MRQVVASWSGGKDSCFACYKAASSGVVKISHIYNAVSKEYGRVSFHGIKSELISLQAQAMGIPLVQRKVDENNYEEEFKDAMRKLKLVGIKGACFGDVELQEHKNWIERVCKEVDIEPILPLWGNDPEQILIDFIDQGFEATIASAKADLFDKGWVGRKVDKRFVEDLYRLKEKHNFHILGESGEFHTFVTNGPNFKQRIKILETKKVLIGGYWFLDIVKYELKSKKVEPILKNLGWSKEVKNYG